MADLEGRVAIVTGAGRGIGRAIALRLAQDGADVVVAEVDMQAAQGVVEEIEGLGRRGMAIRADVSNKQEVQAMVRRVLDAWGRVDVLVNNAGILGPTCPVVEIEEEGWDRTLDVHLKGTFLCSQAVVPHMVEQGWGRIVSMSSVAGKEGNPNLAPYSVAKAGIICFTKSLGKEVATTGVTVNCISPTVIETDLIKGVTQEYLDSLLAKIPMRRTGKTEEVAALVSFLASDEAAFTTGQCYDLSGGRSDY
jgi:3-oxoacyl-[acyl-carrier protein] reductase